MELMLLDFFEESMVVSFDGDEAWLSTENWEEEAWATIHFLPL